MTDHLATGMKRMIRTVARSASLSDRLGEQSRLLRLTGNRSTLDFRPAEHGASSWDFEMSITPTEPKPYGNAETREPVWRETVDSATYGESRARVAHAVETFRIYDNTGILPETENRRKDHDERRRTARLAARRAAQSRPRIRPLTDDYLFANSIWPEPELLGLVDDLTGRTGRNL